MGVDLDFCFPIFGTTESGVLWVVEFKRELIPEIELAPELIDPFELK